MKKKRRFHFLDWLEITVEFFLELMPMLLRGFFKAIRHILD